MVRYFDVTRAIIHMSALGLLATLSACAPYLPRYSPANEAFETGFYENIETPRLALLEYRLARYFAWKERPYEVVCASEEKPSVINGKTERAPLAPDVELALIKRFPGLSPLTRCKEQGNDVVAVDTGVPSAIFDVNEFTCEAPDNCVGWGGYYANGQHGWSYYRLKFERGEWRIKPEDLGIVVT
ncbi:hypothetical protein [Qipengyuania soli]|uniref:Lipoprotein n=1 Tax=Qipengyuania soli TaxID=2782568 RepID=A0A7S8IVR2_9SPHN|nr:hypothetical protein [Qipengyuania soli]QPD00203.1 hypothetical protein IRL76_06660 [Qipengyuania soli]